MYVECRLIEHEEYLDRQLVGARHGDPEVLLEPGMMWFCPQLWDHQDPDLEQYLPRMIKRAAKLDCQTSLSLEYLNTWATKRDPLAIMMPHHDILYPDSAVMGFRGYRITGPLPRLSIDRFIEVAGKFAYRVTNGMISQRGDHG